MQIASGVMGSAMEDLSKTIDMPDGTHVVGNDPMPVPTRIGRFRVDRLIGQGGFGQVYLAHDDELQRSVAIKVPHPQLIHRAGGADAYLAEARAVAKLDHPNIVSVFDVGSTADFPCFIVSNYVDGTDLATRIKKSRLSLREAVGLVATVAEALHHAHKHGLVHRDVKPGNILLDQTGKPFVADFGLALREQDVGREPGYIGTPAYMSPEQARGEGHRVDGRSDVFSLGIVLYELIAGRRPFRADSQLSLMDLISNAEVRPPRQIDDAIPRELDRICLKALSKRVSDRYSAARDLADDLLHFLESSILGDSTLQTQVESAAVETAETTPAPTSSQPVDSQPLMIVPKGLRSFDEADADFFLELLPGPKDRNGLPESIRFWKSRIEEVEYSEETLTVGLIYGPSGCGKSSMVKAGLIPRLKKSVNAIYVESTAEETESRLLKALGRRLPGLPQELGLIKTLSAIRLGKYQDPGQKVLLVLDQFEQWLHARCKEQNTELVQALRQCDGEHVQCIVMVRDDFWMAATRFMRDLEVSLSEGLNSAAVDLFPIRHAERVLKAFGRAFSELPANSHEDTRQQRQFVKQAVSGLAEEGQVVPVRLALFAEMVKGKPWDPATLKQVGGTQGVGVNFLEESFVDSSAPPLYRLHRRAAQQVLNALMPEAGSNIKGQMASDDELLKVSGYVKRPKEFVELVRILDRDLRLITPTEPENADDDRETSTRAPEQKHYQLTHDYLVPSLRDWLTRKQKETRTGRALLCLAERSALWHSKRENRHLPSWSETASIYLLSRRNNWTETQQAMMTRALRYHGLRAALAAVLLLAIGFGGLAVRQSIVEQRHAAQARGLVDSLVTANTNQVPAIVSELQDVSEWASPLLSDRLDAASEGSQDKLHFSLAMLPTDRTRIEYLSGQLPTCNLDQFSVVRSALGPFKEQITEELWQLVDDETEKPSTRFQAAAALAEYVPNDSRWKSAGPFVTEHLASSVSPIYLDRWLQLFRPAHKQLVAQFTRIHADDARPIRQREAAAIALADYLHDEPLELVEAAVASIEYNEFAPLIDALAPHRAAVHVNLAKIMHTPVPMPHTADERDSMFRRHSLAAAALVHLKYGNQVWSQLKFDPRPTRRSFMICNLGKFNADHNAVSARLAVEPDISIRRALIQILGWLEPERFRINEQRRMSKQLQKLFYDPDPGLHAAALWALKRWHVPLPELSPADGERRSDETTRGWYVNGQGQTMVVFRDIDKSSKNLNHHFEISSREVTVPEFLRFNPKPPFMKVQAPTDDCPMHMVNWFAATKYCNWLNQQEGIPQDQWVYAPNLDGKYDFGMTIKTNYRELTGYRLPDPDEWEHAGRAGTLSSFNFGESMDLLDYYAWHGANSAGITHPVESLLPNEAGLFAMHGNVSEWTQKPQYYKAKFTPVDSANRIMRGGSYRAQGGLSIGFNGFDRPGTVSSSYGIRLVRSRPGP